MYSYKYSPLQLPTRQFKMHRFQPYHSPNYTIQSPNYLRQTSMYFPTDVECYLNTCCQFSNYRVWYFPPWDPVNVCVAPHTCFQKQYPFFNTWSILCILCEITKSEMKSNFPI